MGAGREVAISLDGVRDKNLMPLKKLNTSLFPDNDKYYADVLASADFTKLADYSGICVGAIACGLEKKNIGEIYLHVQTNNEDAINFYKKFGFEITDRIHNYYTNVTPPDCYVITKLINQPQAKK